MRVAADEQPDGDDERAIDVVSCWLCGRWGVVARAQASDPDVPPASAGELVVRWEDPAVGRGWADPWEGEGDGVLTCGYCPGGPTVRVEGTGGPA